MIISHELKVIYIKQGKVAGSSFEIALSKYCGKDDVITPLQKRGDIRESLGFRSAQNYKNPKSEKSGFYDHTKAKTIKSLVAADIWNNYLKIATIRCPYDRFISYYFFNKSNDFPQFTLRTVMRNEILNADILHIDGEIAANFLIRFEYLDEDIGKLERKIDCPGLLKTFQKIRVKGNYRPKIGASSYEMYAKYPKTKLLIDAVYYKYVNKYEFMREYWPQYKAKLETAIRDKVPDAEKTPHYVFLIVWWLRFNRFIYLIIKYSRQIIRYTRRIQIILCKPWRPRKKIRKIYALLTS